MQFSCIAVSMCLLELELSLLFLSWIDRLHSSLYSSGRTLVIAGCESLLSEFPKNFSFFNMEEAWTVLICDA